MGENWSDERRKDKNKKEEEIYTKESTAKTNPWQKQKESTTKTNSQQKQIHGKNKSTTKTNPRQKQIHDKNNKDSTAETNPR